MKTFLIIILYLIVGSIAGKLVSILANLAGGLGSIVGSLGKPHKVSGFRRGVAIFCCTIMQAYVFLAWMAFVISYTILVNRHQPVVHWLVWIVAFSAAVSPLAFSTRMSALEERANPALKNTIPSISLNMNCILDGLCFFLFAFIPILMLYGWSWVPYVRAAVQP